MRTKFVIYDGIDYFKYNNLASGAHRINIWHGVPGKMLGKAREEDYVICGKQSSWSKFCIHIFWEIIV